MRDKINYPLPSPSTLVKWAARLDIQPGFFGKILSIMDVCGQGMTEMEKICVIEFDEMSVSKAIEFDSRTDTVIGPHKNMQVIMVRGLFSGWKQTIFARFDFPMSKDTILEAI